MIVLPDDDEMPVSAQVSGLIGDALRQSVADVELSPDFAARLAAALDSAERSMPQTAVAQAGSQATLAGAGGAGGAGAAGGAAEGAGGRDSAPGVRESGSDGLPGAAGQGSEAAEAAS